MWRIICRPDGKNPGWDPDREQPASEEEVNAGSIIVLITHDPDAAAPGFSEHEIARIGWVRRNSKNPGEELKPMVDKVIAAARVVIDALNDPLLAPGQRS